MKVSNSRSVELAKANAMLEKEIAGRKRVEKVLRESQARLEGIISSATDAIITIDAGQRIILFNAAAEQMFQYKVGEVLGRPLDLLLPERVRDIHARHVRHFGQTGVTARSMSSPRELHGRRADGEEFPIEAMISLVEISDQKLYTVILRDITVRKQVEKEIRLLQTITQEISEVQDFHSALAIALDRVSRATEWDFGEAWTPHPDGTVLECSPAWYSSTQRLKQFRRLSTGFVFPPNVGLAGQVWSSKCPKWIPNISTAGATHPRAEMAIVVGLKAGLGVPIMANDQVLAVLIFFMFESNKEDKHLVDLVSTVATQLGSVLYRKRVEDERVRLLQAVREQRRQLRALAMQLAETQEIERKQLAQELHDQVGQNLTALGLNLNVVRAQLPDDSAGAGLIQTCLDDSLALVEQTTESIRDVMANLRPPVLDDYGLVAALKWYGIRFASRVDVAVTTTQGAEPVPRLAAFVEHALFRIAQEALTNAAKHAQATQITVSLTADADTICLVIADDGCGFDLVHQAERAEKWGWGLLTMTERAEAVGGRCRIESGSGQGTRVVVELER